MVEAPIVAALATAAAGVAPQLPPGVAEAFRAGLPEAAGHVCRQVLGAVYTENVGGLREQLRARGDMLVWPAVPGGVVTFGGARRPGNTLRVTGPIRHELGGSRRAVTDPAALLALLLGPHDGLAAELVDSAVNLAVARARRPALTTDALSAAAGLRVDEGVLLLERLATEGHNLHPCSRTRLGMTVPELLRYDVEGPGLELGVLALRADVHVGDDVGTAIGLPAADDDGYVLQPVHPWQLDRVITERHADAVRAGLVRVVDGLRIPARPTASLRTVLTDDGHLVKVSLDVQITSTRRSISLSTARNAPVVSALVDKLLAGSDSFLLGEYAGAGARLPTGERDVTALLRRPLEGLVDVGELAVPGNALPARCPHTGRTVLELLVAAHGGGPREFLTEYATALLRPVLRLAAHGVGLEAHLQNCVPLFRAGRPTRMVFRDLGGVRLHAGRLAERGHPLTLWPGSVTGTDDVAVLRAKVAYTALANHLGAVVAGLDSDEAGWVVVGQALRDAAAPLLADADLAGAAASDLAAFTGPAWWHKALVTMRLHPGEDVYVPIDNPLRP